MVVSVRGSPHFSWLVSNCLPRSKCRALIVVDLYWFARVVPCYHHSRPIGMMSAHGAHQGLETLNQVYVRRQSAELPEPKPRAKNHEFHCWKRLYPGMSVISGWCADGQWVVGWALRRSREAGRGERGGVQDPEPALRQVLCRSEHNLSSPLSASLDLRGTTHKKEHGWRQVATVEGAEGRRTPNSW